MIEEFLNKKKAGSYLNTPSARKSLEGETIDLVLQITEDETLFITKSACGFIFSMQGTFEALGRDATSQRVSWFLSSNKLTADSYQELNNRMDILKKLLPNQGANKENADTSKIPAQSATKTVQQ
jgi:hypothetical protein